MLFADFLGDACGMFMVVCLLVGWGISSLIKGAGKALKDKDVQDGIKLGFWWWLR